MTTRALQRVIPSVAASDGAGVTLRDVAEDERIEWLGFAGAHLAVARTITSAVMLELWDVSDPEAPPADPALHLLQRGQRLLGGALVALHVADLLVVAERDQVIGVGRVAVARVDREEALRALGAQLLPRGLIWQDNNDFSEWQGTVMGTLREKSDYDHVLPNLDFDIEVVDNVKARFSYSKTIARAQYNQLRAAVNIGGSHVIEHYLDLLKPLGIEAPAVRFDLPEFAADANRVEGFLRQQRLQGRRARAQRPEAVRMCGALLIRTCVAGMASALTGGQKKGDARGRITTPVHEQRAQRVCELDFRARAEDHTHAVHQSRRVIETSSGCSRRCA